MRRSSSSAETLLLSAVTLGALVVSSLLVEPLRGHGWVYVFSQTFLNLALVFGTWRLYRQHFPPSDV